MLRTMNELERTTIHAMDGVLGQVDECYFDEEQWTIRYLVLRPGKWLHGRRVLVSPMAVSQYDWEAGNLRVLLTREQVKQSPRFDMDRPVSRRLEAQYHAYYGWPVYWGGPGLWGPYLYPSRLAHNGSHDVAEEAPEECRLRSSREVIDYTVELRDGSLGHVEDCVFDDHAWVIQYLAVNTDCGFPSRQVLMPPQWAAGIDWAERRVTFDLTREQVQSAPEWHPPMPIRRQYELRLHEHYGRKEYWHVSPWTRQAA